MELERHGEGNSRALTVVVGHSNVPALRRLAVSAAAIGTLAAGAITLGRAISRAMAHKDEERAIVEREPVAHEPMAREQGGTLHMTRLSITSVTMVEEWISVER